MSQLDLIIKNGIIVDGSGAPPFKADIGINGDIIVKIGDLDGVKAERVINASGLIVVPGFIDIHNHSDTDIFIVPTGDNYVMQGVTTLVIGNCGSSPAPLTDKNYNLTRNLERKLVDKLGKIPWRTFSEYLKALDSLNKSVNIVPLVGHGTIRSAVLGDENVQYTNRDLREMKDLVKEAIEAGAFGLSTGLIYIPGMFAKTQEIVELTKVVSKYGGIYATHMRNEGNRLLDAVMEAITIGIESNISVEISHLKASGIPAWGNVSKALALIEDYVRRGYDFSADAYPYTASSTGLEAVLPSWAREGGMKKLVERLSNSDIVNKIEKEMEDYGIMEERYLGWDQIVIANSESYREFEGKSISEIADKLGISPIKIVAKLLVDDDGTTSIIIHSMNENDVKDVIKHPLVAIGSDGSVKEFGKGKPHPRNYGTYPRILAKYVRELKVISLSEAIRKMTSLPARKLKLWDRGLIRPGFKADITIFNYYSIKDTATFENPHQYPKGIKYVIVNGVIVVEENEHTKTKPGKLLKRSDMLYHISKI
jgi:N-acyl-D-amino-acid deacylase